MNALDAKAPSLKRVIGVTALTLACFNTIVGSGIFGLPGQAAALLGPASILAYLVCVVLVGLVALCLAEAGSRVTSAGGLYAYARVPFGPVIGGIEGTLLWTVNSVVPNAAIAAFLTDTLATRWAALSDAAPRAAFLACLYGVLAIVNVRGTRSGARLSVLTALIKLAPLVFLIAGGMFRVHPANLHWSGLPTADAVGKGSVLLFFAFMGVEGGLNTSGEVRDPARTVPRAIFITSALVAFLYIGLQTVAQGVLGPELAKAKAPLVATATALWGDWGARLLTAATILSASGYLTGDMLASPRSLYALAESGQLPRKIAAVHPRFLTPAAAIVTYSFLCFMTASLSSFRQLVIIGSSGTLVLYLICCLGLLKLRADKVAMAGEPFQAPGKSLVPLAASMIIIWMLTTVERTELAALGVLVLGAGAVYGIRELSRPNGRRRAAVTPE